MKTKKKFGLGDLIVLIVILALAFVIIRSATCFADRGTHEITFEELYQEVAVYDDITGQRKYNENNNIKSISFSPIDGSVNSDTYIVGGEYVEKDLNGYSKFRAYLTKDQFSIIQNYCLLGLDAHEANSTVHVIQLNNVEKVSTFDLANFLGLIIPIVAVVILFFVFLKSANNGNNQAIDFGKSRANLAKKTNVTFNDVAGLDEEKEELLEVVDFLKNPNKYFDMGARIPKGILLCGSPGTGKTLIARAVAGEANVPFYSISGSDFVEMFVGVGASRVRDMFQKAKQTAPCIIFIDEIDAVGRQRGAGLGGGHDEREQTLNQLLVEMDGFAGNSGIIVMAATNRVDILDPALLRPGRFDRTITVSNPDFKAREAILKVHARNKKLSPRCNLADIAKRTPGFSGADLENLLNEAALLAARENLKEIKIYHIDEAIDRVMMGPAKKSKKYTDEEKRLVAFHEAGHAVIGLKVPHANVVQKITIIPRGEAGGYNLMTPEQETFTQTREFLLAEITSYLAGRIAEEVVFNEMTTGAHNDFQHATAIARAMVAEFGMSSLGPVQYEVTGGHTFLGRDYLSEKRFSDQVALEIDQEVRKIINECYERGKAIIIENRNLLDLIANHLIEVETLTKEDIDNLLNIGYLPWWEKKKAKIQSEKEAAEKAEQTSESVEELAIKEDCSNLEENEVISQENDSTSVETSVEEEKESNE